MWQKALKITGFTAILFAVLVAGVMWRRASYQPPGNATTFAELAAEQAELRRLAEVSVEGERFYVWRGEVVKTALPSGPSCFVFDTTGDLVAFTPSTGDGELATYCDAAREAPETSIERVLSDIEETRRTSR